MMQGEIPGGKESVRNQRILWCRVIPYSELPLWNHNFLNKDLPQGRKKSSFCKRPQNNSSCLPVIKSITLATGGKAVFFHICYHFHESVCIHCKSWVNHRAERAGLMAVIQAATVLTPVVI